MTAVDPVTLRRPRRSDADELARLHVRTWEETYTALLPPGFFDEAHRKGRREMWHHLLGEGLRHGLVTRVAVLDDAIIGFGMTGPIEPRDDGPPEITRQLYMLYVLQAHHGRGVGQRLLDTVAGTDAMTLWVAKENPRAIAFYRKNGFVLDGTEKSDPGAPAITDARMVRPARA
ncbi:N-acetyltransferase [Microbacterium sp. NPDC077184]|uniref:GNAT family N-acetyltransferase n=1 Tax=Microbacterium sp. NPDC077184 TaxID=3154764 RepID=UPI0034414FAD